MIDPKTWALTKTDDITWLGKMYGELFNKNNLTEFIKTMVDDDEESNTDMTTKQPHKTDNFEEDF